jgi:hypothetical protein
MYPEHSSVFYRESICVTTLFFVLNLVEDGDSEVAWGAVLGPQAHSRMGVDGGPEEAGEEMDDMVQRDRAALHSNFLWLKRWQERHSAVGHKGDQRQVTGSMLT